MDLRVIVNTPSHMSTSHTQVTPLLHAIPQYRMLTGTKANKWNNLNSKNIFTVGNISSDFNSVQTCLNAVPAGSYIIVYPGLYNESIEIKKSITLVAAAGFSSTFLTATVIVSASHVTLDGFTVNGNSRNESLLIINGSHVHIQNCRFTGQYMVDQPIHLHITDLAISFHNCRHVKILNNIFSNCLFALSMEKVKHLTVRSNVFGYGHTSMVMQQSANVHVSGNLFKFNRAIMWLDNSSAPSFADNAYYNNLQSDVCQQYKNQIMFDQKIFIPELRELECHHLNISTTLNTTVKFPRDVITLPDHVVFKGWCGNQVDKKQAVGMPGIEEQLYVQNGCIVLLGSAVATVYPQGICSVMFH